MTRPFPTPEAAASSAAARESVDVCVCTYRRPHLEQTLRSLAAQNAPGIAIRMLVADNDEAPTAKPLVEGVAAEVGTPILYLHAPSRNISLARNACLEAAGADWVAFIDDDEVAPPDWLARLRTAAEAEGADVVFGPALAVYPDDAPDWIKAGDYHTNRAPAHDGEVRTGHTCNALMRWRGAAWRDQRFLLEKGRTGGEDVEFFFRLSRGGARLAEAADAPVYEPAAPERLTYDWIKRRRFLAGQFHGAHSEGPGAFLGRVRLIASAGAKILYCLARAGLAAPRLAERRRWFVRAIFHAGVCAGAMGLRQREQY
ncbi:MAG: glycosyltransferase family 2 protein [Pseudomonadota bacterium]